MSTQFSVIKRINTLTDEHEIATKNAICDHLSSLRALRNALEALVCLIWIRKIGIDFINPRNKNNKRSLFAAMTDERFVKLFEKHTLLSDDLHLIRKLGNDACHPEKSRFLTAQDSQEALRRFDLHLAKIKDMIGIDVLKNLDKSPTHEEARTAPNSAPPSSPIVPPIPPKTRTKGTTGSAEESALTFFEMLENKIADSNKGLTITTTTKTSASVNKATKKVWLALDFLVKNGIFRVAIYIPDDSKTHYYDRLFAKKDEIKAALGFDPEWLDKGAKSDKTRWIKTELRFSPYSDDEYDRLINEALPIIEKYVEVFSLYLPEAFR